MIPGPDDKVIVITPEARQRLQECGKYLDALVVMPPGHPIESLARCLLAFTSPAFGDTCYLTAGTGPLDFDVRDGGTTYVMHFDVQEEHPGCDHPPIGTWSLVVQP